MKNKINSKPISETKKILVMGMFIFFSIFLISNVSALEWDNKLTYSENDLKVNLTNWFGLGVDYGSAELKSHSSVDEIREVKTGKDIAMFYDFNFNELYENGLGEVIFTDIRTGKQVERNYKYVYWSEIQTNTYGWRNCKFSLNGTESCNWVVTGTETNQGWLPYASKDIPAKRIRIGIETEIKPNDYIDGIWKIGGKRISRHATFRTTGVDAVFNNSAVNASDFSTYTFPARELGEPDPTRTVIVTVDGTGGGGVNNSINVSTLTVDGNTARFIGKVTGQAGNFNDMVSMWFINLTTETTGDIVVTFDSVMDSVGIAVWAVYNFKNVSDVDTNIVASGPITMTLNLPKNGSIVGIASFSYNSGSHTGDFSGITEDFDQDRFAAGNQVHKGGSGNFNVSNSTYFVKLLNVAGTDRRAYMVASFNFQEPTPSPDNPPIVSITNPVNNSNITSSSITFAGVASDNINLVNVSLYINGVINQTNSTPVNGSQTNFTLTLSDGTFDWFYGAFDNSSQGTNASGFRFTIDSSPVINIISPTANNTNFTTSTIFFNATNSLPVDTWIVNYNGTNHTLTAGINTSLEVEDGSFQLLLYANNSVSGKFGLNDSIFFTVDSNSPKITVTSPNETFNFHEVNTDIKLNWNYTDPNPDTCRFDWNNTNVTVTCTANTTTFNVTTSSFKNLTFYANDTFGNSNSSFVTWNYKIFQNSVQFNLTTIGGSTEQFKLNITKLSSLQISTVNLIYNSVPSSASFTSGDISIITAFLNVPNPSVDTNFTFNFSFLLSDSSIINTTSNNQTVFNLGIGDCSTFSTLIYNFTLLDEVNQTFLQNVTIDYAFNLFDITRNTQITNFSLSSTINPTTICISQNLTGSSSYSLDAVLQYVSSDAQGYLTRFYNILNFNLKNSTIPNIINIYDVTGSIATPFRLTFRDSNLALAPNILVNVNKQFVDSNDFKTVEIPITDTNGQTVLNLVRNTAVYNLIFIDVGGNVVASFSKINAFCQDFTIGECVLELNAISTTPPLTDTSTFRGISYILEYTNSTSTATLTFNSLNSTAVTARIVGTTQNQFGNRTVCDNSLTTTLGTLNCDASSILTTDNFLYIDIFSGGIYVETRVININPQTPLTGGIFGSDGFFIAFFLFLTIIILFSEDKQVLLVMLGIGWVVILILQLVKGTIIGSVSGGIWLLVSIATMLWKLRKEESGR